LLETSLHDVPIKTPREVNVSTLFGKAHARVRLPTDLLIADLRDASLRTLGIERSAVASSPREHYPCTRRVAKRIHSSMQDVAGIVWHSRQAEINQRPAAKVLIVFADRVPTERGDWQLVPDRSSFGALLEGSGWLLVDRLADSLGVTLFDELSWISPRLHVARIQARHAVVSFAPVRLARTRPPEVVTSAGPARPRATGR